MSTTLTLVVTQSSATMSLPITGLVRPVGVGEVIFCRPSFAPKSYLELSLLTESTEGPYPAPRKITTTTTPAPSAGFL